MTCIARLKPPHDSASPSTAALDDSDDSDSSSSTTLTTNHAIRTLTSQIKGMAMKATGSHKCAPCTTPNLDEGAAQATAKTKFGLERSSSSRKGTTTVRSSSRWGKEMEARLRAISSSSGEGSPSTAGSGSGRRVATAAVVVEEETEEVEWVAQVEPGVLITFVSLPKEQNSLRRIRFSRDTFDKWQAQRWWTENYEKVMELYNVKRLDREAFPLPTPPRSDDKISKPESTVDGPVTPPLTKESLPGSLNRGAGMATSYSYSSSDSFEEHSKQSPHHEGYSRKALTPKQSKISSAKMETSSFDGSVTTSSSRDADRSQDLSVSNTREVEAEWVEEFEAGVYITIGALPSGRPELRRVRFSRERFGEMHARLWWEENRARVHERYL